MPRKPTPAPVSDLEAHLGYWLRLISNHVSHGFRRKLAALDVSVSEWVVLRELYRRGATSPGTLVQAIGLTKGAISKLVDRLADKRLIDRTTLAEDRRHQAIELTPRGRALVPRLAALADQNDHEFFAHMPASQREQIVRAMQEVARIHHLHDIPVD